MIETNPSQKRREIVEPMALTIQRERERVRDRDTHTRPLRERVLSYHIIITR